MTDSNNADGRKSFDITTGNTLVEFFNRNASEYPVSTTSPKFDLVPVQQQKDLMLNVARMHAQQEYDRIMDLVAVLQKQASDIKRRLDITDMVHAAKYEFKTYPGQCYWLVLDHKRSQTRLSLDGPTDWATAIPEGWEYICRVKWLGDYTWTEVE